MCGRNSAALPCHLSIDGTASIYCIFIYISGSTRSRNFIVSGSFQPPYARASFLLNKSFICCIVGTTGIKPRPPAQQASALSITPSPLGQIHWMFVEWKNSGGRRKCVSTHLNLTSVGLIVKPSHHDSFDLLAKKIEPGNC